MHVHVHTRRETCRYLRPDPKPRLRSLQTKVLHFFRMLLARAALKPSKILIDPHVYPTPPGSNRGPLPKDSVDSDSWQLGHSSGFSQALLSLRRPLISKIASIRSKAYFLSLSRSLSLSLSLSLNPPFSLRICKQTRNT